MGGRRQPDPEARWLSHALVGLTAGAVVGKKTGAAGFVIAALASAALHEVLDAPVAVVLGDLGV